MKDALVVIGFIINCVCLGILCFQPNRRWNSLRHGKKPIGTLTDVAEDLEGFRVSGTFTNPTVAATISDNAGSYSFDVPPKPEWETKTTWFDIDQDTLLGMSFEDWQLFTKSVQQTWVNMLRNDGYKIGETLETQVMDYGGLVFGMKKVELRVKVHKEEK